MEGKYKDLYKNWAFQHKEPLTRETLNNQLEFDMYIRIPKQVNYFLVLLLSQLFSCIDLLNFIY